MKLYTTFIFLLLSFILLSCSSVPVNHSYNHTFDFTAFTTYKIVKEAPMGPSGNPMPSATYGLIESAINYQMARKGFGKNEQFADFGITWYTALNDEVYEVNASLGNWEKSFAENEEGMLIIDLIYLNENKVVWRGWANEVLSADNLEERINEAVEEIFEPYPPKSAPTGN